MKEYLRIFLASVLCLVVGFAGGWFMRQPAQTSSENAEVRALRLKGYQYTNPLLFYNSGSDTNSQELADLQSELGRYIDQVVALGKISQASVFFRDFSRALSVEINPDNRYVPASLNKLPVLMTVYKMAEAQPGFLGSTVTVPASASANSRLEIQPSQTLVPGNSYSVAEAKAAMIKYSDNNAYEAITQAADYQVYAKSYDDLNIPIDSTTGALPEAYMTARDFSSFLRVLYNATYLTREYSERALSLLTESEYKNALTKPIPAEVAVAHKFGIYTNASQPLRVERELHDCGIIYLPEKPYLLCVMTKGTSILADSESVIADISKITYDYMRQ